MALIVKLYYFNFNTLISPNVTIVFSFKKGANLGFVSVRISIFAHNSAAYNY